MRPTRLTYLVLIVLAALSLIAIRQPLAAHAKAFLLLSQALPQSLVKPLHWVTTAPIHRQLRLESRHGPIVADLFLPTRRLGRIQPGTRPALIFGMGVGISDADRPLLLSVADTMARLGYVVLWPRLEALDRGAALPEEPATFVAAVRHLQGLDPVDPERISILGLSTGGSIGLVAANDPQIADDVRALIFFGGYYDTRAYLLDIASRSIGLDGHEVAWSPYDGVVGHAREMLAAKAANGVLRIFDVETRAEAELVLRSSPPSELAELRRISPSDHLDNLSARLFILHDRGDRSVPYFESVKLDRALPERTERTFLLTDVFEHLQPKGDSISWQTLGELFRLYGFVYATLSYL